MKDRTKIILILLLSLAAFLLLWWLLVGGWRKPYSWREHYRSGSKDPYGTFILYELLGNTSEDRGVVRVRDSLYEILSGYDGPSEASYVFVGEAIYMDSLDLAGLLEFVGSGNTAFLSSKTIPYDLMFHLYYYECEDVVWNDYDYFLGTTAEATVAERPSVPLFFQRRQDTLPYQWSYIGEEYFCETYNQFRPLGWLNDQYINFAAVPYLDGWFYLHTSPIAFSNISLLDSARLGYAEDLFGYIPPGRIYWDAYSKVPEAVGRNMNQNFPPPNRRINAESPLQYVLSQPPLAWAWYLLLAMGLLYLIFRTRRRQRIIPVAEPNQNTSLEFISTIGRLYFLQQNHKQLCLQKTRLFLSFIRNRYGLPWRELHTEKLPELSRLSGIPLETLEKIALTSHNLSNAYFVSENSLIDYHRQLDHFYRNCM